MRYFIELRYNGGAYCGWQRQPDMPSVQQTIEGAISTLLREPILLTGAGRTDTGVNASYYVAHFDTSSPVADPEQVVFKLNHMLPGDIAVSRIVPVAADAHARFSAREREYRYYIEPRKNPFTRAASWQYYVPLDVAAMNRAADVLMEFEDFTSFAKLNSDNKTNICHLKRADWTVGRDGTLCFTIRADRFLRNMVRAIVGTLVDVVSTKGAYLGTGFLSLKSKIRVRLISRNANDKFDRDFYARRIRYALDYRRTVMGAEDFRCCRLIFGEADSFPGFTVDRFGDVLVAQVLSLGTERVKDALYELLVQTLADMGEHISAIYERNDVKIRELEGMDCLLYTSDAADD